MIIPVTFTRVKPLANKYRHYTLEEISRQKARHLSKQRKTFQPQTKDKEKVTMGMFKDLKNNLVLNGNFDAVFKGVEPFQRANFDDNTIMEPAFRFTFYVPAKKGTVDITTSTATGKKSNFRKVLVWLMGDSFKPSVLMDDDYLEKTLNEDLLNKPYQITCQPSESGERTVIVACFPASEALKGLSPTSLETDDIPF